MPQEVDPQAYNSRWEDMWTADGGLKPGQVRPHCHAARLQRPVRWPRRFDQAALAQAK